MSKSSNRSTANKSNLPSKKDLTIAGIVIAALGVFSASILTEAGKGVWNAILGLSDQSALETAVDSPEAPQLVAASLAGLQFHATVSGAAADGLHAVICEFEAVGDGDSIKHESWQSEQLPEKLFEFPIPPMRDSAGWYIDLNGSESLTLLFGGAMVRNEEVADWNPLARVTVNVDSLEQMIARSNRDSQRHQISENMFVQFGAVHWEVSDVIHGISNGKLVAELHPTFRLRPSMSIEAQEKEGISVLISNPSDKKISPRSVKLYIRVAHGSQAGPPPGEGGMSLTYPDTNRTIYPGKSVYVRLRKNETIQPKLSDWINDRRQLHSQYDFEIRMLCDDTSGHVFEDAITTQQVVSEGGQEFLLAIPEN